MIKTKQKQELCCCPESSTFGFLCVLFQYEVVLGRSSLLKFYSTSSLTEAELQASAPSFVQIPDEGGSNRTDSNTSRITYP